MKKIWLGSVVLLVVLFGLVACSQRALPPTSTSLPEATYPPTWTPTATPHATAIRLPTATPGPHVALSNVDAVPSGPTATPPGEDIIDPNYVLGKAEYTAHHYRQVLKLMSKVITANPNLAPPHWYRGMAYYYTGNYQLGYGEMEDALSLDPNYALGYADRGLMISMLGDDQRALVDYQKALSLDPTLAKVHHNMSVSYFDLGNYDRQLAELTLEITIDPGRANGWNAQAQTLENMQRYQECVVSADLAIKLQPDLWSAYFHRGSCQIGLEHDDLAIADLTMYLKSRPNSPRGWYNLAWIYDRQRDFPQALKYYAQAIKFDPTFSWTYINRRKIYNALGHSELAVAEDETLTRPKTVQEYITAGDSYSSTVEYGDAISAYQSALSLAPHNAEIQLKIAQV